MVAIGLRSAVSRVLPLFLALATLPQGAVIAATSQPSTSLDLSSTHQSILVSNKLITTAHVLNVGSQQLHVVPGSILTPAEFVALQGLVATGHQTLMLDARGQATGGTFSLSSSLGNLSSLVIPAGVTGVVQRSSERIVGDFIDKGALLGLGTAAVRAFTLSAGQVDIERGGLLSTIAPSGLTGITQSSAPINLKVSSGEDIFNAGTISASGVVTLLAAGNVSNTASGAISGARGIAITTGGGGITNSGSISAAAGDIILATSSATDLVVNNAGGQISAPEGAIDFRTSGFNGSQATQLIGGTLNAQTVNFFGGNGAVDAAADQIDGVVNVTACSSHVTVDGGTLNLGKVNVSGDPVYVNENGDVNLTTNLKFSGQDLAILASHDVAADNTVTSIDLSSTTQHGGNLSIVAGAVITGSPPSVLPPAEAGSGSYQVTGMNGAGGNVHLFGVNINTSSKGAGTAGGQVVIVANEGTNASGDAEVGGINASSSSGNGGTVLIMGNSISVAGNIDTHSSSGEGGSVTIQGAKPTVSSTITYSNGTPNGSYQAGSFNSGSTAFIGFGSSSGNIITSGKQASGAVSVQVDFDTRIAGNIQANATGTGSAASGQVSVTTNEADVTIVGGIDDSSKGSTSGGVNIAGGLGGSSTIGEVVIGKSVSTKTAGTGGDVFIDGSSVSVGVGATAVPIVLKDLGGIVASGAIHGGTVSLAFLGGTGSTNNKDIIVGTGITTTGSASGGPINVTSDGIFRSDGPLNTTSSTTGGEIIVTASGGNRLSGIEINGNVTGNGKQNSNGISLQATGGELIVRGNIISGVAADRGAASPINLKSQYDTVITGSVLANGDVSSPISIVSNEGQINIKGLISSATATGGGAAGSITIKGDTGVVLGNSVSSQGNPGGNIIIESIEGILTIAGSVNSSGLSVANGTGANAGSILIGRTVISTTPPYGSEIGPALIQINGSVLANGGSATGATAGSGGKANNIALLGDDTTFSGAPTTGSVFVGGTVSAAGGSTTATGAATKSGDGGLIDLDGATVQVKGVVAGASVNASAGKGGAAPGSTGQITIASYPVQPLTTDFDLTSTKQDQVVLPGALFQIGNASVNGTTGALVAGTPITPDSITTGKAILLTSLPSAGNNVTVSTTFNSFSDHLTIVGPTNNTFSAAIGLSGPQVITSGTITRGVATPGEALALLQDSRNGTTQTIGLTSAGAVSDVMVGGGTNAITLNGEEFGRPMTAFNLATATPGDPQGIIVTISQPGFSSNGSVYMPLPKSGSGNSISGTLNLFNSDPTSNPAVSTFRIDFGSKLTLMTTGQIETSQSGAGTTSPSAVVVDMHGTGPTATLNFVGNGTLTSLNTFIRNEGGGLTLALSDSAQIKGGGTINGQLFLSAANGTKLTSPLAVTVPKNELAAPVLTDLDISMFGKSITVGSLALNPQTLEASGPLFSGNTKFVVTESLTGTTMATPGGLAFGGNSTTASANFTGGNFSTSESQLAELASARFDVAGTLSVSITSGGPVQFVGGAQMDAGKDCIINAGSIQGIGFIQLVSTSGNVSVTGASGINIGTSDQVTAAKNVTFKTTAATGALDGEVNVGGLFDAGSAKIAQQTTDVSSGVLHSYVKTPGAFSISAAGNVTVGSSSFIASTGANVSIIGGVGQTPGAGHGDVTISGADTLQAVGGNVIVLGGGNVDASSPGMTFFAEGFTTGGSGGVEVRAGTTTSTLQVQLAHRPAPASLLGSATVTVGLVPEAGNVQVTDVTPGQTGTKKGLVDFSTATVNNPTIGNVTTVLFNKGAVIFGAASGLSVTIDQASITSIDPVAYEIQDRDGELIIDSTECSE